MTRHSGAWRTSAAWTPREDAALQAGWAAGDSAGCIAQRLGRTRDSVIGRAHRLAVPGRPSPIRPAPPCRLLALGAALDRLTERSCRWIEGDALVPPFDACPQPRAHGAYCADHGRIAYRPPVPVQIDARVLS